MMNRDKRRLGSFRKHRSDIQIIMFTGFPSHLKRLMRYWSLVTRLPYRKRYRMRLHAGLSQIDQRIARVLYSQAIRESSASNSGTKPSRAPRTFAIPYAVSGKPDLSLSSLRQRCSSTASNPGVNVLPSRSMPYRAAS